MAEYIDRKLIEWYGCDFEDVSCENRECSGCSHAECSYSQVMQIPTADVAKELKEENDRLHYTIHALNQDGINLRNEVARTNNAILKKNKEIKNLKKAIKQIKEILEAKVDMFEEMGDINSASIAESTLNIINKYLEGDNYE